MPTIPLSLSRLRCKLRVRASYKSIVSVIATASVFPSGAQARSETAPASQTARAETEAAFSRWIGVKRGGKSVPALASNSGVGVGVGVKVGVIVGVWVAVEVKVAIRVGVALAVGVMEAVGVSLGGGSVSAGPQADRIRRAPIKHANQRAGCKSISTFKEFFPYWFFPNWTAVARTIVALTCV